MLNLQKKLKEQREKQNEQHVGGNSRDGSSIRDRLLMTEVQQLPSALPPGCRVEFPSSALHNFLVIVRPVDGMYAGGCFRFEVTVPPEYNFEPPSVKCLTRVWHPNISEAGSVCLSVLRSLSTDGMGWNPARGIKDVVFGIYALFGDLIDFNDPLNHDAASMYQRDPAEFRVKVKEYMRTIRIDELQVDYKIEKDVFYQNEWRTHKSLLRQSRRAYHTQLVTHVNATRH